MVDKTARALVDFVNRCECEPTARVFDGYSGRGMFGERTTAIIVPSLGELIRMLATHGDLWREVCDAHLGESGQVTLGRILSDTLGNEIVVY